MASKTEKNASKEENMHVSVRMRPLNEKERTRNDQTAWKLLPQFNSIAMSQSDGTVSKRDTFTYDHIFGPESKTEELYDLVVDPIVDSVLKGIHGTVFAYGQTSCGKTYTMQGHGSTPGILQMAVLGIFEKIEECADREFLLRVSYIEIYNEVVRDLLDPKASVLKIRESRQRGVFVEATEKIVTDFSHITNALRYGDKQRHTEETKMNERSSRSHTIFKITLESKEKTVSGEGDENQDSADDGAVLVADLNLVDLAGSENVRHTGVAGDRLREAGKINTSLLTLSRIIKSLASGHQAHLGFRDSKLTRLLQESLTGKTRTALIACATPSDHYIEETRSTLLFAQRAKTVKTCAEVNEILDDAAMLRRLRRDLKKANAELEVLRSSSSDSSAIEELKAREAQTMLEKELLEAKLCKLEQEKCEAEQKVTNLKRNLLSSDRLVQDENVQPSKKRSRIHSKRQTWCPGTSSAASNAIADFRRELAHSAMVEDKESDLRIESLDIMALENVPFNDIEQFVVRERDAASAQQQKMSSISLRSDRMRVNAEILRIECTKLRDDLTLARSQRDKLAQDLQDAVGTLAKETDAWKTERTALQERISQRDQEVDIEKEMYVQKLEEIETMRLKLSQRASEDLDRLKNTLSLTEAERDEMRSKYEATNAERESLLRQLDSVTKASASEAANREKSAIGAKLGFEILQHHNVKLESNLAAVSDRTRVIASRYETLMTQHEEAKSQMQDLRAQCDRAANESSVKDERIETLLKNCDEAKRSLDDRDIRISELQTRVEELMVAHSSSASKVGQTEELEASLHETKALSERLRGQVEEYDQKLQDAVKEAFELRSKLDDATAELARRAGVESDEKNEIESLKKNSEALHAQLDEMSGRVIDLSKTNASLIADIETSKAELEESRKTVTSLRNMQDATVAAKSREDELTSEVATLRLKLDEASTEFESKVSEQKKLTDAMKSEWTSLQERNESLETQLAHNAARASEMSAENTELRSKVEALTSELIAQDDGAELRAELDTLKAEKRTLVETLAAREQRMETMVEEMRSNAASDESAEARVKEMEEEIERVSSELTDLNLEFEERKCEWAQKRQELETSRAHLESKVAAANDKLVESARRIKKLESVKLTESQVARMIEMKKEWKLLKKEKKAGLWSKSKEKADIEKQITILNEKVTAMTAQKRKYKDTIAKRDSALKQARTMMQQVHAELADAKKVRIELDSLNEKFAEKSEALDAAEEQLLLLQKKGTENEAAAEMTADMVRKHKSLVQRLRSANIEIKSELAKVKSALSDEETKTKAHEAEVQRVRKHVQVLEKENLDLMLKCEELRASSSSTGDATTGANEHDSVPSPISGSVDGDSYTSFDNADIDKDIDADLDDEDLLVGDSSLIADVRAAVLCGDKENNGSRPKRRGKRRGLSKLASNANVIQNDAKVTTKKRGASQMCGAASPKRAKSGSDRIDAVDDKVQERSESSSRPAMLSQSLEDGEGSECAQQ